MDMRPVTRATGGRADDARALKGDASFVYLRDGATIAYQIFGETREGRTPLLILDGIGCSGWAFRRLLPELAAGRKIMLLHYRGHGISPDPPRPWHLSMPTLADDAAEALDHAGIQRAIVIGFSMGFPVALELYRRHRHRVLALVSLAGPSGRVLRTFQGTQAFGHALPLLRATTRVARDFTLKMWRAIVPSNLTLGLGLNFQVNLDRIAVDDFEFYTRQLAKMNPELFVAMLEEADRHSAADIVSKIDVPVLVIAGAKDTFVPLPTMRKLAFAIPGVQWQVLAEATHALPAEYPTELIRSLRDFARQVDSDAL